MKIEIKQVYYLLVVFNIAFSANAQLGGLINKVKGGSSTSSSNLSKKDQENLKSAIKESEATQKVIEEKLKKPDWKNEAYVKDLKTETTKLNSSTGRIQLLDPSYDISAFKKTELDTKKKIDLETGTAQPTYTPVVDNKPKQEDPKGYVRIWDKSSKYFVKNEGFTNKFHEQNSGKILFSDKEIKRENTDITYFKTSFNSNSEGIYGRVYLPTSICNYAVYKDGDSTTKADNNPDPFYKMYLYADGKLLVQTDKNDIGSKSLDKDITTFYSIIVHKIENRPKKQWYNVIDSINKLKPGLHKMRLELVGVSNNNYPNYKTAEPIAVGEFDLNVLVGAKIKYGKKWSDIKAGMANETLTTKALNIMNAKAKDENWKERFKKAKITDSEWTIKTNYLGVPEYRRIDIEFYTVYPDGHCEHVNISFHEDYVNGTYGSLKYSGIGSSYVLDCD